MSESLEAAATETEIPDQRLAMLFVCAHPAIEAGIRAPLMLQAVLGLDARAIASAFLTSPAAMSKRLGRAKDKIRQTAIAFRVPGRDDLPARLDTGLDAVYAAYAEGWTDPAGTDVARRDLTEEAVYLARLVAALMPNEPEALGLLALLLHAPARRSADGDFIPLAKQDPELWHGQLILEAEALLRHAGSIGAIGRYQLEAALQSAHVHRCRTGVANWRDIVQIYNVLFTLTASPVVALNRALAIAEVS